MTLKHKAILAAMVAALSLGLFRYCDRDRTTPTEPGKLAPGEKERIEVKGRTVTVIRADKTVRSYAPGGARVSVRDDGTVNVDIKRFGLSHEAGLGVAWNGDKLKLSLDGKFVYYRRLGLHGALTYDPTSTKLKDIIRPAAFVSSTMPFDGFANTSLFLGTELFPQRLTGGIRLAF